MRKFAVGHDVQAASQLVTGIFIINLFVFVNVRLRLC
jgi:hypothetical protein